MCTQHTFWLERSYIFVSYHWKEKTVKDFLIRAHFLPTITLIAIFFEKLIVFARIFVPIILRVKASDSRKWGRPIRLLNPICVNCWTNTIDFISAQTRANITSVLNSNSSDEPPYANNGERQYSQRMRKTAIWPLNLALTFGRNFHNTQLYNRLRLTQIHTRWFYSATST